MTWRCVLSALFLVVALAGDAVSPRVATAQVADVKEAWRPDRAEVRLRTQIESDPNNPVLHRDLAELLSYQSGRLADATAQFRVALVLAPDDRRARRGLARCLAWSGQSAESSEIFDLLLEEDPHDAEAHFGRGQLARWGGNSALAQRHLDSAIELTPDRADYYVELGWIEFDANRYRAAERAIEEARRRGLEPVDLEEVLAARTAPSVRLKNGYSDETNDFRRANVTTRYGFSPWLDTRLDLQAGYTHFRDSVEQIDRFSLGADLRQGLPIRSEILARYVFRKPTGAAANHELGAEVRGRPLPLPLEFSIGGTRHSMVDPRPGFEDVAHLEGVGSGGNSVAAISRRRQISEAYGGLSGNPAGGTYVYSNYSAGWINDDNERQIATAGAGVDLLHFLKPSSSHNLTVKYDFLYMDYDRNDPEYFSPSNFIVHTPSLDWRWWPTNKLFVGLEGGVPIEPGESPGWLAGGFAQFQLTQHVSLAARLRHMENRTYHITSGVLGLDIGF